MNKANDPPRVGVGAVLARASPPRGELTGETPVPLSAGSWRAPSALMPCMGTMNRCRSPSPAFGHPLPKAGQRAGRKFPKRKFRELRPWTGGKHPTPDIEHRTSNDFPLGLDWRLGVGCWMFDVSLGSWRASTPFRRALGPGTCLGVGRPFGVPPSGGPDRLKPGHQTAGSWKGAL
jgi:hypothetical protein